MQSSTETHSSTSAAIMKGTVPPRDDASSSATPTEVRHVGESTLSSTPMATWKKLANNTVSDFLDTLLDNPQCSFLYNGGMFFSNLDRKHPKIRERRSKLNLQLQKQHCDMVYELLLSDMDWVGTTDRLRTETLPLFQYLFQLNNITGKGHSNKMKRRMQLDRLNTTDLAMVKERTAWDQF